MVAIRPKFTPKPKFNSLLIRKSCAVFFIAAILFKIFPVGKRSAPELVSNVIKEVGQAVGVKIRWTEEQIISHMEANPNRAYFFQLFRDGGFRNGMEVGVEDGRFTENCLTNLKSVRGLNWTIIEPTPNANLEQRYNPETGEGSWKNEGLTEGVEISFFKKSFLDEFLMEEIPSESFDFIYLNGDSSYEYFKDEISMYWEKVTKGGVLAGHDYCNYGQKNLPCNGCDNIPECMPYTEYGVANGMPGDYKTAKDQDDIVTAVQEWMMEIDDPRLTLRHTQENFTQESLAEDGMDYDLVISYTRNPSWYLVKPTQENLQSGYRT